MIGISAQLFSDLIMGDAVLSGPIRNDADIDRLLLSRVRDDARPYRDRERFAGHAVRALLARVGNPHHALRCIHIAGSKGKGSVALMCEHLLQQAGMRTGTFTSPHLQQWNERIRIDGHEVDSKSLAHALDDMRPHLAQLDDNSDELSPSFFDLLTATALLLFARAKCDSVILECGLGGRLDATNIITPVACCITSIELEHTDKLGNSLRAIAEHKAGIIKTGVPVVTARFANIAQTVIGQRARLLGAPEWRQGRDWNVQSTATNTGFQCVDYERPARASIDEQRTHFTLPHSAPHMAVNAGLALSLLASANRAVDASALGSCTLPARAQVIRSHPWIIVDGAHTEASLNALAITLQQWPVLERRFVISATRGKSMQALAALVRDADAVWITRADPLRSAPADEVAALLAAEIPGFSAHVIEQPAAAFEHASADLKDNSLLCVCGSVYVAGAALRYWQAGRDD